MERGLYIHIPFCVRKCGYCDFYSLPKNDELFDKYTDALVKTLLTYRGIKTETLYIGGGTPSLLGVERLDKLMSAVNKYFGPFKEATIEANPADDLKGFFAAANFHGINRVSLGMQSTNDRELGLLTRRHSTEDVKRTVEDIRNAKIDNISLDLMLATPAQTKETLIKSIDTAVSLEPKHISAYLLKTEPGTEFYKKRESLAIPDDDTAADMYLLAVSTLRNYGYNQYEISNFALDGYASVHNTNYWRCKEYIGVGPSAHGYLFKKRYYYPRDIKRFITSAHTVEEGIGGTPQEFIMLNLRLKRGLVIAEYEEIYKKLPDDFFSKVRMLENAGYLEFNDGAVSLNEKGFLVSISIIAELLAGF